MRTAFGLAFFLTLFPVRAQDPVEVKTNNGGTPTVRMSFTAGAGPTDIRIQNARLRLYSAAFLNVSGSTGTTAGDIWYTGTTLRYLNTLERVVVNTDEAQTLTNKTLSTSSVWNGGTIGIAYGGTNATSFTSNQFLWYDGTSLVASGYTNTNFLARNAADTSSAANAGGALLSITNTSTTDQSRGFLGAVSTAGAEGVFTGVRGESFRWDTSSSGAACTNYAVHGYAGGDPTAGSNTNIGVFGHAVGSASLAAVTCSGVYGYGAGTNGATNYGVEGAAIGNNGRAVYGRIQESGTGTYYGIYGLSSTSSTTTGTLYALYGTANASGAGNTATVYGLYATATGGGTNNYGVFATASGTGAYAGYFSGDVYITGTTTHVGTTNYQNNVTFDANVTLGNASSDTVTFNSLVNTAITPSSDNAYDLGTSGNRWRSGYYATSVTIGSNPSTTGSVRLSNAGWIAARNAANSGDVNLVRVNASNLVELGTSSLVFPTANAVTLTASAPSGVRTYTMSDVGANANFVMTEGTQTINGAKTLSANTTIGGYVYLSAAAGPSDGVYFSSTATTASRVGAFDAPNTGRIHLLSNNGGTNEGIYLGRYDGTTYANTPDIWLYGTNIRGNGSLISSMTWNGSTITVNYGGTGLTSVTAGRIPFGSTATALATSANLFWDDTNSRLGIGTSGPGTVLDVVGAGSDIRLGSSSDATHGVSVTPAPGGGERAYLYVTGGNDNHAGHLRLSNGNSDIMIADLLMRNAAGTTINYVTNSGNSYFNGGSVGINTSSPATRFHVRQTAVASSAETIARFTVSDNGGSYLDVRNHSATDAVFQPKLLGYAEGTLGPSLVLEADTNNDSGGTPMVIVNSKFGASAIGTRPLFSVRNNNGSDLFQVHNNGYVGIGMTSTPVYTMDIRGSWIRHLYPASGYGGYFCGDDAGSREYYFIGDYPSDGTLTLYAGGERISVNYSTGNVGIGNNSPSFRLDVSGTARATSDMRAPIFYDTNDTGYYTDPNSTSRVYKIGFAAQNTINSGLYVWDTGDTNHVIYSCAPGADGGARQSGYWDSGHRFRLRTYAIGQGFLFENSSNVNLLDIDSDGSGTWCAGEFRCATDLRVLGDDVYNYTSSGNTFTFHSGYDFIVRLDDDNNNALEWFRVFSTTTEDEILRLTSVGDLLIDGTLSQNAVDVAERFPTSHSLEAGDVVCVDTTASEHVIRCAHPKHATVVGIVSTDPALVLGDCARDEKGWKEFQAMAELEKKGADPAAVGAAREEYQKRLTSERSRRPAVALAGRVPCKVDATSAPIRRGDLLTSSDTPGHAKKLVGPGQVIGVALEDLPQGRGKIVVLVRNQYHPGN